MKIGKRLQIINKMIDDYIKNAEAFGGQTESDKRYLDGLRTGKKILVAKGDILNKLYRNWCE